MLRTETVIVEQWYDYESVRALSVFCDCGRSIPDDVLERCAERDLEYMCSCGKQQSFSLSDFDKLADKLEWRIPELEQVC